MKMDLREGRGSHPRPDEGLRPHRITVRNYVQAGEFGAFVSAASSPVISIRWVYPVSPR